MPDAPDVIQAAGAATGGPVLSSSVPTEISLSGQNYIELGLSASAFIASAAAVTKEATKS